MLKFPSNPSQKEINKVYDDRGLSSVRSFIVRYKKYKKIPVAQAIYYNLQKFTLGRLWGNNIQIQEQELMSKSLDMFILYIQARKDAIYYAYREQEDKTIKKILTKLIKKKQQLNLTMCTDEIRHSEYPYADISWDRWLYLARDQVGIDDHKKLIEYERSYNEKLLHLEIFLLKKKIEHCKQYRLSLIAWERKWVKENQKWKALWREKKKIPSEGVLKKRLEKICGILSDRKNTWYLGRFHKIDHYGYDIDEYFDILNIQSFWGEEKWFENAKQWELNELKKMSEDKKWLGILAPVVDSRQDWEYNLQNQKIYQKDNKKIRKYREESHKETRDKLAKYPCDKASYMIDQEGRFFYIVTKNSIFSDLEKASKKALYMRRNIDFKNSLIRFDLSCHNYDEAKNF